MPHSSSIRPWCTLTCGALLLTASALGAQRVTGNVLLPGGGGAAPRVLIEVAPEGGGLPRRALTDDEGRFTVELPGAGRYQIRALRIGFAPSVLAPQAIAVGQTARVRIVLGDRAVVLSDFRVSADAVCSPSWPSDTTVVALWEEARKALLAAHLTARSDEEFEVLASDIGALAAADGSIHPATRTEVWREGLTMRPFASVPADALEREGYVTMDATGAATYRAPDFDVLLDPSFVDSHCLRAVAAPAERAAWVGLAFEPNQGRMRSDIEGTLWIDRATAQLRELSFRFTGIVGVGAPHQGGRVAFAQLPTGHWVVTEWELRMPRPLETDLTVVGGRLGEVTRRGEVLLATDGPFDDTPPTHRSVVAMACGAESLSAAWGMARGEVDHADGLPAVNATVRVEWRTTGAGRASLEVTTDVDGQWQVCKVPVGVSFEVTATSGDRTTLVHGIIERGERLIELSLTLSG